MSFVFTRDILELEKASKRCESGANLQDFDVYLNDEKRKSQRPSLSAPQITERQK